jgi:hypothetical protein
VLGVTAMSGVKYKNNLSEAQIEERARKMGMKFPDEVNVINSEGVKQ